MLCPGVLNLHAAAGFPTVQRILRHLLFVKFLFIDPMRKNFVLLSLALLAVVALLYAGVNGMTKDHSYGFFFTFTGAVTTIGLGLDIVNQLKSQVRKASVRKLGRM